MHFPLQSRLPKIHLSIVIAVVRLPRLSMALISLPMYRLLMKLVVTTATQAHPMVLLIMYHITIQHLIWDSKPAAPWPLLLAQMAHNGALRGSTGIRMEYLNHLKILHWQECLQVVDQLLRMIFLYQLLLYWAIQE